MTTNPKAFISHASEDKEAFVLEFAKRLMGDGVDVWLDLWEIGGGDSLPERVFEQGIGGSDAVVVVLSRTSLAKPWVREELDVAVVRRIEGKCRLIPVVLDDADVPVSVNHLFRYDFRQIGMDGVVDGVTRTLFGRTEKPMLGQSPSYVAAPVRLGSSDPADEVVYDEILRVLRNDGPNMVRFSDEVEAGAASRGVSRDAFRESMEALTHNGRVKAQAMLDGGRWWQMSVPDRAWLKYEAECGLDVNKIRREVLSSVVNGDIATQLSSLDLHWRTVSAVLGEFQAEGLLRFTRDVNGGIHVSSVSPLARRKLRDLP